MRQKSDNEVSPSPEANPSTPSSIDAVTFDVGSTLIHPSPSVEEVFYRVQKARGHNVSFDRIASHMGDVDAFYVDRYDADGDFWCTPEGSSKIWIDMYEYLSRLVGLEGDSYGIAHDLYANYCTPEFWAPYDDVIETLDALAKRRYAMAVISNWGSELSGILKGMGLAKYFSQFSISADVGMRKPDPNIFSSTAKKMGLDTRRIVHVGDLPDADGDGARAVGMHPVIIDRNDAWPNAEYPRVTTLTDVPALIERRFRTTGT